MFFLTLSLLGYLKTRICCLNPMFDVQIWQMIHHWKALVLYFKNLQKKLQICKSWIFYRKIQLYSKMFAKKLCPKKWKIIHFWKALDHAISNMQKKFAKFYQNLTSGSGSKQRFSLLQEKAVIQAVWLRPQAVSIKARF